MNLAELQINQSGKLAGLLSSTIQWNEVLEQNITNASTIILINPYWVYFIRTYAPLGYHHYKFLLS